DRLIATRRVGYTPAAGRILLRRRFNGLFGDRAARTFSTTGVTMKSTTATASTKQNWTAFELLMLAPFGLLLWYVATQPLVLPAAPPVNAIVPIAAAAVPAEQVLAAPVTRAADPDAPVFVTAGTTVLQRIAPVARVTLEAQEAAAAPQDTAQAPASDGPAVAVPVTASEPAAAEPQVAASMRIEITDGTGVDGFVKDITSQLEKSGVTVTRTTNMTPGAQNRTVILYRDGFEQDAERLSKLFARPPALVNNTRSRKASDASDVRLVLGSAAVREKGLQATRVAASGM
ncbi:MAG TPA: LytR C-terminal domain-containing protein, partial [Noviherbaspirillum sp.]|nr:LytR C-terminal domain-containing protein [Noviherbaspirillum sp.]